jgi:serpin B
VAIGDTLCIPGTRRTGQTSKSGVRGLAALLVASALAVASCGSDEPSSATTDLPPSSTAAPATTAASPSTTTAATTSGPNDPAGLVARAPVDPTAPTKRLATGFNDAGFDLLRTLPSEQNVVFSPLSIGHALLMAEAAADGDTQAAIDAAFALPERAHEAWNAIDQQLAATATDGLTVSLADRIWPHVATSPKQEWLDLLAAQHGAETEPLDLQGDPEGSRRRINQWVSDQTKGLIPELLPEGFINPLTVLVLTDAIYFQGDWQIPFGKYPPVDRVFTRLDGSTTPVELMQELELADRRGEGDGFVGAEIPYVGGEFSMLVIVPDDGRFAAVRNRLSQDLLDEIDATFTTGPYKLLLPKWEDTANIDLLPWLQDIGAAPGSFPAIAPDAFLDAAVHAADITVDEFGTTAAAATGLGFAESGPPRPELTVAADQPFFYVIRHRPTGVVLFAGQVTDPTG